jgi:DNA repair exonuclease SbcCD nuclease subunit
MRIVHLADLHLGFRAYHRTVRGGINAREADVALAFRRAVDRVIALRPDLVLVAGDVFHSVRPSNTAIAEAFQQFSRLSSGTDQAPILIVAGNHDSPRSAETVNILTLFRQIPNTFVACGDAERIRLDALDASVLAVPDNSLGRSDIRFEPEESARYNFVVLHGNVSGAALGGKTARFMNEHGAVQDTEIGPERWDYVALGHYHIATRFALNMWYAGALERTSTNIWVEDGPKGFVEYDTETREARFHEVETRPMIDLPRLDATGLSVAEVDERLRAAVEGVPGGIAEKIVRQVVTGIARSTLRALDHERMREWRSDALHFQLDARTPESRVADGRQAPAPRATLEQEFADYAARWTPSSPEIDRGELVRLGLHYLARPKTAEGEAENTP